MSEEKRRLAGIVAGDVVGYSAMVAADEPGTLARVRALRTDIIEPLAAAHGGRVFKTTGDGFLAAFASAVQALRCAIAIQDRLSDQADGIRLRIGVHQGEVVADGDDMLGDGVIIASRLEPLAEPGGICISARVREDAAGKMALEAADLGTPELKNISAKIQVFRVRLGATERLALLLPDKPSLVVLPFQNMSGDPEQEYFADGMVEEITTALSRIRLLFVIARNSAFTYKGRAVDVRQVGRELGVRYVLEGSVRKAANRVRITGQLIDTTTGAHIWADRFDGALDDIFDLQDQVASSVAGAIEPKLRLAEIERAAHKPTESLDAYDLYLRALAQVHKLTSQAMTEAIALSRKALQLDPTYAAAAGVAAWCRGIQRGQGWVLPTGPEDAEGIRLARLAIECGANDPEALWMAAYMLAVGGVDHMTALAALDRALALNPNSAHAWGAKAFVESFRGNARAAVAVEACDRASRLSPLDPLSYIYKFALALASLGTGHYQVAMTWIDDALREQPRFHASFRVKVALCGLLGQSEEGRDWLGRLLDLQPGLTIDAWLKHAVTFLAPETRELMVEGFRKAGLPEV